MTVTGATRAQALSLTISILKRTRGATAVLLDHTVYQAVEEARARGRPAPSVRTVLGNILRVWNLFLPLMTLRPLGAPSFLWQTLPEAAKSIMRMGAIIGLSTRTAFLAQGASPYAGTVPGIQLGWESP
eukprot:11940475-Heterocapsa_arctica.AAC.1